MGKKIKWLHSSKGKFTPWEFLLDTEGKYGCMVRRHLIYAANEGVAREFNQLNSKYNAKLTKKCGLSKKTNLKKINSKSPLETCITDCQERRNRYRAFCERVCNEKLQRSAKKEMDTEKGLDKRDKKTKSEKMKNKELEQLYE